MTIAPKKPNKPRENVAKVTKNKVSHKVLPRKDRLLPGGKPEKVVPIENEFDLICHIQFEAEGRKFGAYLLDLSENLYCSIGMAFSQYLIDDVLRMFQQR